MPAARRVLRAAMVDGRLDSVRTGRLLLAVQGVLVAATAPLLGVGRDDLLGLAAVSVVMVGVLAGSFVVPWSRLPATSVAAFPLASMVAFIALGIVSPAVFAPITGFLTLSFVYSGLTMPARWSLVLTPVGVVTLVVAYGGLSAPIAVRCVIAAAVWSTTAYALAWLTAANSVTSQALERAALVDELTGIPNRRDLQARMSTMPAPAVMVVLDIDHFKRINDTLGHAAGDQVLRDFGAMLRVELRIGDYCSRLGGEEFVVVLPEGEPAGHLAVLARLRQRWSVLQPDITFSTGSARHTGDRLPEAVLARADQALYAAKNGGRNTDRDESDLDGLDTVPASPAVPHAVGAGA